MANVGDLSGVAINYVTFGTPVQIERPPTGTYLGLMVPLAGRLTVEHEGQAFQADPALGTGVVLGPGADDGDLFVALQKFDAAGKLVNFPYFTLQNDGQAAHGWQRISHRELDTRPDPRRARIPGQPIHPHQREVRAAEGEILDVCVELWPSSTLFRAGESLRLLIQGTDIQSYPAGTFVAGHHLLRNRGPHTLHTGGRLDAHLLLPVIWPAG